MTKTAHTPGPWELVSLSGYGSPFSVRMPYIAETAKPDQTHYGVQSIRRREDAALIVAAPDLLAALRNLIGHAKWVAANFDIHYAHIAEAEAAIAKAEGRS